MNINKLLYFYCFLVQNTPAPSPGPTNRNSNAKNTPSLELHSKPEIFQNEIFKSPSPLAENKEENYKEDLKVQVKRFFANQITNSDVRLTNKFIVCMHFLCF